MAQRMEIQNPWRVFSYDYKGVESNAGKERIEKSGIEKYIGPGRGATILYIKFHFSPTGNWIPHSCGWIKALK